MSLVLQYRYTKSFQLKHSIRMPFGEYEWIATNTTLIVNAKRICMVTSVGCTNSRRTYRIRLRLNAELYFLLATSYYTRTKERTWDKIEGTAPYIKAKNSPCGKKLLPAMIRIFKRAHEITECILFENRAPEQAIPKKNSNPKRAAISMCCEEFDLCQHILIGNNTSDQARNQSCIHQS